VELVSLLITGTLEHVHPAVCLGEPDRVVTTVQICEVVAEHHGIRGATDSLGLPGRLAQLELHDAGDHMEPLHS